MFSLKKADFDATMGVFFDGFTKVIIAIGALLGVLSPDVLFGKVMSGMAVSVFALHVYFWFLGEQMKKKTKDDSYVALPGGVSAYRFFIYLFSIFFVVLDGHGADTALLVTIAANFIGSIVFILGAWIVPLLMKVLPAASIFGALAGASLGFLGINVLQNSITVMPLIGFVATFIILFIYLGNIKTKLPAVLIAIVVGAVIGWTGVFSGFTPENVLSVSALQDSFASLGIYLPQFNVSFLTMDILSLTMPFLPLIIAFAIGDVVNVILGVEQAKSVGHEYNDKNVIIMVGLFSLASSFFGNPFPFTIFFGYNTWKQINAGTGYSLITGGIYLILGLTGLFAVITNVIPTAAVGGILLFIALSSTAQAFETSNPKHFAAIAIALIIPIIEVATTLMGTSASELAPGLIPLAQGSTIIAILWSAILIFVTDNKWKEVNITLFVCLLLTSVGLIHAPQIALFANVSYMVIYVILMVIVSGIALMNRKGE